MTTSNLLTPGDAFPALRLNRPGGDTLELPLPGEYTVVLFYRGGWCPYCMQQLQGLAGIEAELKAAGVQLLAISMDQPAKLRATPDRDKLAYRLLSDADAAAVQAFGIAYTVDDQTLAKLKSYHVDLEASSGRTHHILPHPAVFVVDARGVVRFAHADTDYKVRLDPAKVVEAAGRALTTPGR